MGFSKLSKRQYLTLFSFALAEFFNAICVSLQAPFFPQEAELKGATATEYGSVFGVFELVVFFVSPWYGKHVGNIGPERMFFGGITTSAVCSILFGFLDVINGHILFISLAFIIRIIEALGNAAFLTAGFAIIAHEFSNNIASTFASLETFFGLGLIAGPTMGGILYQMGGFTAPFVTLGLFLFICAILTKITLPTLNDYRDTTTNTAMQRPRNAVKIASGLCSISLLMFDITRDSLTSNTTVVKLQWSNLLIAPTYYDKVWKIFHIKGMAICTSTIVTTTISISFISATLEPHIRKFNLSPVQVGLIFIVNGAVYAITAPAWGWLCDSKCVRPKAISILGGIIMVVGVIFLGPAPFIPLKVSINYIIFGLILHGLSIGARLVSSFTDALQMAVNAGMPNAFETFGLISALWTSSVAFGSFVGPTVSGFLYDHYGFANASVFIIGLISVMVIAELWSLLDPRHSTKSDSFISENIEPLEPVTTTNITAIKNTSAFMETYTVGISSNRVLNLVYSSNPDLRDETAPLLEENRQQIKAAA